MIGIGFIEFLILLIISIIVTAIIHFAFNYYLVSGTSSYISKVIIGWIGAWLGSPVFGHWFEGVAYESVYIIPAILGSIALTVLLVDLVKTFKEGSSGQS